MDKSDLPPIGTAENPYDLLVIGGGVNGCGIARDAAGRGLSVFLCEQGDLAGATSSASTKLFHGGLRYLEYFEFGLVHDALEEREVLLRAMPHISWPMRFVLPIDPDLKFDNDNSALGKLLKFTMPFLGGRRPGWLMRVGLFMYDNMGGREILPATKTLDLTTHAVGQPLKPKFTQAFEYSDCWVQDSRLVVLNARDAAARGAKIRTRTRCLSAERIENLWQIELLDLVSNQTSRIMAKSLVNAGGPWVEEILKERLGQSTQYGVRLVRGSHIVVKRLFTHDQPYFFQLDDGRIIFAIPYENDFTLIGTTEHDQHGDAAEVRCTDEERDYLRHAANGFFKTQLTDADIVWTYSGVRPLYDDGAPDATSATREYVLTIRDDRGHAPLLNVFGGKITTYRRLAEDAMEKLSVFFPGMPPDWTANAALPGGDFPVEGAGELQAKLRSEYAFLSQRWAQRLVRTYGTDAFELLGTAKNETDLGLDFGATLRESEVRWLIEKEWARNAEDIIWRRTKLGLLMNEDQIGRLDEFVSKVLAE